MPDALGSTYRSREHSFRGLVLPDHCGYPVTAGQCLAGDYSMLEMILQAVFSFWTKSAAGFSLPKFEAFHTRS